MESKPTQQRLLTLQQAANYCGLSVSGFRDWMDKGRIPGPISETRRWDRRAIDKALDVLSHIEQNNPSMSAYDKWKSASVNESQA